MKKLLVLFMFCSCSRYYAELQYYPYETDNSGQQAAAIWNIPLKPTKAEFTGFADYDINDGKNELITHPGLWYPIWKSFGAVAEYRYNGYDNKEQNVATGIAVRFVK